MWEDLGQWDKYEVSEGFNDRRPRPLFVFKIERREVGRFDVVEEGSEGRHGFAISTGVIRDTIIEMHVNVECLNIQQRQAQKL